LAALIVAAVLVFGTVVGRVAVLQTIERPAYAAYGVRQRLSTITLPANRGVIFDRNGSELAVSAPQTTVWADPNDLTSHNLVDTTVAALAPVLKLDAAGQADLRTRLTKKSDFSYVARQIDDATASQVEALKLEGVGTYVEPKRFLPAGDLAVGVLGATDVDAKGTAGVEMMYDQLLTGKPGQMVRERDARGRTIPTGKQEVVPPTPGSDVVLTLDKSLQYFTEEALKKTVATEGAKGGMVVVLDTKTGDILTMANVRVDPTTGTAEVSKANLSVVDTYEPGSVAKIVTASAALQEGVVAPGQRILVPYQKKFYDYTFVDAHSHANNSMYDIEDIIAFSSNVGTMELAQGLGPKKEQHYQQAFGFAEPTGLNFPGESNGLLKAWQDQYATEKLTVAYGQGVGVTALQLAAAMNTIANGGTYVAPRLLKATIDPSGHEADAAPSATRQVLTPTTAQEMNSVLRAVVCRGTGKLAAIPGYTVAGKTGTAYKAQKNGTYVDSQGQKHYVGSFAGFVPAEDPRISVIVSIDEPTAQHFGALVAAPLFTQVAQEGLRELSVPPSPSGGVCPAIDKGSD
jgi:cell division protein FtsI (penicillin-binding protein 3)